MNLFFTLVFSLALLTPVITYSIYELRFKYKIKHSEIVISRTKLTHVEMLNGSTVEIVDPENAYSNKITSNNYDYIAYLGSASLYYIKTDNIAMLKRFTRITTSYYYKDKLVKFKTDYKNN